MNLNPPGPATGGRCALHPDRQSQATCARCGSFMCTACSFGGAEVHCPACRQRIGTAQFPFHRDDFSFDRLLKYTFEAWKKQWVMLSVAVLALGGVYMIGSFVLQMFVGGGTALLGPRGSDAWGPIAGMLGVFFVGLLGVLLVVGVGFLGLMRMFLEVLMGKAADFSVLFGQFSKLGRALALLVMMGAIVFIPMMVMGGVFGGGAALLAASRAGAESSGSPSGALVGSLAGLAIIGYLLMIVLTIWLTLPFTFAMLELVHSDAGAVESLKRGYALSKGFRWQILGYRLVGGLITTVGMFACCVGVLPAFALAYMLETSLYLAVRNGSGLPPLSLD